MGTTFALQSGFRIGDVLSRSVAIYSRNLVPLVLVGAAGSVPYLLIQTAAAFHLTAAFTEGSILLLGFLLGFAVVPLLHGTMYIIVFTVLNGETVYLKEVLGRALRSYFPLLGGFFLIWIVSTLGLVLLLVPGFMLMISFSVTGAACAIEQLGPLESMKRSRQLVEGARWKILGLLILFIVAAALVGFVNILIIRLLGQPLFLLWKFVQGAFSTSFFVVVVAVTYYDLRSATEPVGARRMAAVFD